MATRHASSAPMGDGDAPMTPAAAADAQRVRVMLPLPLPAPYDYRIPDGLSFAPGDFVAVPLGRRQVMGVVWDAAVPGDRDGLEAAMRECTSRIDLLGFSRQ